MLLSAIPFNGSLINSNSKKFTINSIEWDCKLIRLKRINIQCTLQLNMQLFIYSRCNAQLNIAKYIYIHPREKRKRQKTQCPHNSKQILYNTYTSFELKLTHIYVHAVFNTTVCFVYKCLHSVLFFVATASVLLTRQQSTRILCLHQLNGVLFFARRTWMVCGWSKKKRHYTKCIYLNVFLINPYWVRVENQWDKCRYDFISRSQSKILTVEHDPM